ncbi:MAG: ArsA family ATPase, partial [Thermoplasmatota archaeon]
MEGLQDKRLVLVAGKGGVGKTTLSCAVALELAAQRKTLLVTIDPARRLADALGVKVGARPTRVGPRLDALMLDPEVVLREHLEGAFPGAGVPDHPLFRQVAAALPGLHELMAVGKLNDLRRSGEYECVVIDTAPTGHALSFLGAPKLVEEVLKEGSLARWAVKGYGVWQRFQGAAQTLEGALTGREVRRKAIDFEGLFGSLLAEAKRIRSFLTDARSTVVLVTLPERLPVEETCFLHEALTKELGMRIHAVVVNKVQPDPVAAERGRLKALTGKRRAAFVTRAASATGESETLLGGLLDAATFNGIRHALNVAYVKELRGRVPTPVATLPLYVREVQ